MRRVMVGTVAAATITSAIVGMAPEALALRSPDRACRFQRLQAGAWTTYEVRATVRCLAHRMNVDADKAHDIAKRESRFDRWAWNRSSDCRGVFQHKYVYWWARVSAHRVKLAKYDVHNRAWYSPRAQAIVTFAMVKRGGWGPWGG